jgi:hypothetical protein
MRPSRLVPLAAALAANLWGRAFADSPFENHQGQSVEAFNHQSQGFVEGVRAALATAHVTPAKFILGLGVLGLLFTWNKNKRKVEWAVIAAVAASLAAIGAAALYYRWPAFN